MSLNEMQQKVLNNYLQLRYPIVLTPELDGWGAIVPDLPGCVGGGDTISEALSMLEDAKIGWLTSAIAHGDPIPEPTYTYALSKVES